MLQKAPRFIKSRGKPQANSDQLQKIREHCRALRDLQKSIADTEETLKERRTELITLERKTLPDLFNQIGISSLGLPKEGNLPAYEAVRSPYYRANIAASWDDEKKAKAFDWLEKHGGGDLIKTEIIIQLPRASTKLRKVVIAALKKLKVSYTTDLTVPWSSLTAFVRECYEKRKIFPPLDILGADVGEVVKLKPRQE